MRRVRGGGGRDLRVGRSVGTAAVSFRKERGGG